MTITFHYHSILHLVAEVVLGEKKYFGLIPCGTWWKLLKIVDYNICYDDIVLDVNNVKKTKQKQ